MPPKQGISGLYYTRSDVKVHNDVILKGRSSLVLIFMGTGAEVFDCNSYICIHTDGKH